MTDKFSNFLRLNSSVSMIFTRDFSFWQSFTYVQIRLIFNYVQSLSDVRGWHGSLYLLLVDFFSSIEAFSLFVALRGKLPVIGE